MNVLLQSVLLEKTSHQNPHSFLGIHPWKKGKIIRLWRPEAQEVFIKYLGEDVCIPKIEEGGVFALEVPEETTWKDYQIYHSNGLLSYDPYNCSSIWGQQDEYYFNQGVHYGLHKILGARLKNHQGVEGCSFTVWAPNAQGVALVADFNHWDGRVNPMRKLGCGVWEIFIPGASSDLKYKFEVRGYKGDLKLKIDPCALAFQRRPETGCVVTSLDTFSWEDSSWLNFRKQRNHKKEALLIYEVHLGSWVRHDNQFKNYRHIAVDLADHVKKMGYNYIELLPITEHPLDESWGYQVSGYFAPTSRFGSLDDFKWFVNHMHNCGIGVIMDWVPGHFPSDDFSLSCFDGTCLFEHEDPRQGWHPHWQTYIFNFSRKEVANFLLSSALFWLEECHIDGLRVDAVASMLYLDYGRDDGEWIANFYGGNYNLEAIEFLKHMNGIIHERHPGVMTIAEESTAFPKVSHSLHEGGLGFDFKWNMGWMNDTLSYFSKDPIYRKHHHRQLTFGLLYAFSESYILPFSHDEVVHGKKSLLSKMPGDEWQKFAHLRLLYSYQGCQPGKKLLFMGSEWGVHLEWDSQKELDWNLTCHERHQGIQKMITRLHQIGKEPAMRELDHSCDGFEWLNFSDEDNSVIAYFRKSYGQTFLCVHHFTPQTIHNYKLTDRTLGVIPKEIFNSDESLFGGSGCLNSFERLKQLNTSRHGFNIDLPPLATLIFAL